MNDIQDSNVSLGVSVVLPVYMLEANPTAVSLLDRALRSIIEQEYPGPFEVLVVDDGCSTQVRELIENRCITNHPNIRVIRLLQNEGVVRALNTGIKCAHYPYIARIDADDFWQPTKIAQQLTQFQRNPNLTLSATGMTRSDQLGTLIDTHIRKDGWKEIIKFAAHIGCPFPHGSVLARTDIFRLFGGYSTAPEARHIEDFDLWARWIRFFEVAIVEAPLYSHTVSSQSISALNAPTQLEASHRICAQIRALDLDSALPEAITKLAEAANVSITQAGVLAYKIWRHPIAVQLPSAAIQPLRKLLPDRSIGIVDGRTVTPIWKVGDLIDDKVGAPDYPPVMLPVRANLSKG